MLKIGQKRFRMKGKRVVADSGEGPIRAVLIANGPMLAMYPRGEQREIQASALGAAVEWYMSKIVPLFFGNYAFHHGYRSESYGTQRNGSCSAENNPLVYDGFVRKSVIEGMEYELSKSGTDVSATIHYPLPANDSGIVYGLFDRSQVNNVLRQVTADEVERIAQRMAKALSEILSSRQPSEPPRQPRAKPAGLARASAPSGVPRAAARRGSFSPVRVR